MNHNMFLELNHAVVDATHFIPSFGYNDVTTDIVLSHESVRYNGSYYI